MSSSIQEVVNEIDGLTGTNSDDLDLDRLHALVGEFFSHADASANLDVWFRLYERFPEGDGYGVFWTLLHRLEAQPGSNECVIASVQRNPTPFPLMMIKRLLNSSIASVSGVDLRELLRSVAADERRSAVVREDARRFLERHGGQT
jgi:hypothetical protein